MRAAERWCRTSSRLLGAALLCACSGGPLHTRLVTNRDSTLYLPAYTEGYEDGGTVQRLVFLSLLDHGEDGGIRGALARSWEHSADGSRWTFHLRTDVKWQDGPPVTARDVKFTLDLLQDPDVLEGWDTETTTPDDSTVVAHLTRWTLDDDDWTRIVVLPEHVLKGLDPRQFFQWDFWNHPVGDGPYRFVRRLPQTLVELEADSAYFRGLPRIRHVVVRFVRDVPELIAGSVDAAVVGSPAEAARLSRDPRFRVYTYFDPTAQVHLFWRHDDPLFSDVRVRRAIAMSIDRKELAATIGLPDFTPISDGVYTERQFRRGRLPRALPYDPAGASALLDEAGWVDTDGDGVRDRNGRPFRFTIVGRYPTQAVFLREQLRRVGLDASIQRLDPSVARQYEPRIGEVMLMGFNMRAQALAGLFGASGENHMRYRNPRVTELLEQAERVFASEARDSLYGEVSQIYRSELPSLSLYPDARIWAVNRRVEGLEARLPADLPDLVQRLWLDGASR